MTIASVAVGISLLFWCCQYVYGVTDPLTRAKEMVQQMTLSEKFTLMAGVRGTYIGNTLPIDRLGIPALKMQDGPQGFRTTGVQSTGNDGTTTAWPSLLTAAASWDKDLIYRMAHAMGEEFKGKGANVQLGPGIGIARVPTAGRNFEYLSGEDPVLGSALVGGIIRGIQENGVIANAKHYVNNEIEHHRMMVSANVDERTRFELYYPPFQAAVDAGVLSVMCAYNRINDVYACQNNDTLVHLREDMGFKGFVVSDWTATKSTAKSLSAGLDQEMPLGIFYSDEMLQKSLNENKISLSEIDNAVTNILYSMYAIGLFDNPSTGDPLANVTSAEHNQLAREVASNAAVLLKNTDSLLPLELKDMGSCIAVFGDEDTVAGGGSGNVIGPYIISPALGISSALAEFGSITQVIYNSGEDLTAAAEAAKSCETAIVVVAVSSSEGDDRDDLSLGDDQNNLVTTVASSNKRTVVVVNSPGAVLLPWIDNVSAVIMNWLPGQEYGSALADVLFGKVNPSGRLPITLPNKENEIEFSKRQYPGVGIPPEATYSEELLIGYRWYDAKNVKPVFEFGFGLSYTSFKYSSLKLNPLFTGNGKENQNYFVPTNQKSSQTLLSLDITVENIGSRDGSEIVQLYLSYPKQAREPPKQLRSFAKVNLSVKQSQIVPFNLVERDVAIWNVEHHAWEILAGEYSISIGASSRDIRASGRFIINKNGIQIL